MFHGESASRVVLFTLDGDVSGGAHISGLSVFQFFSFSGLKVVPNLADAAENFRVSCQLFRLSGFGVSHV